MKVHKWRYENQFILKKKKKIKTNTLKALYSYP